MFIGYLEVEEVPITWLML
uniref:Uncharacterized protein n=1 Tax=Rhizophora mucronata TaxID=61149 RepID=A0A2P2PMZ9_RHIMU